MSITDNGVREQNVAASADSIIDREMTSILRNLDSLIDHNPQRFLEFMRDQWSHTFHVLVGEERVAYQSFRAAALRSQETHQAAQRAMVDLRGCIESLGRVVAPKPE